MATEHQQALWTLFLEPLGPAFEPQHSLDPAVAMCWAAMHLACGRHTPLLCFFGASTRTLFSSLHRNHHNVGDSPDWEDGRLPPSESWRYLQSSVWCVCLGPFLGDDASDPHFCQHFRGCHRARSSDTGCSQSFAAPGACAQ